MTFADYVARQAGTTSGQYELPEVRDDSPLMRQIAAEAKTDTKCKHCGHPIYKRPMRDSDYPASYATLETGVWDLVYREYDVTTTCHGTGEEFGTPLGHEPTPTCHYCGSSEGPLEPFNAAGNLACARIGECQARLDAAMPDLSK